MDRRTNGNNAQQFVLGPKHMEPNHDKTKIHSCSEFMVTHQRWTRRTWHNQFGKGWPCTFLIQRWEDHLPLHKQGWLLRHLAVESHPSRRISIKQVAEPLCSCDRLVGAFDRSGCLAEKQSKPSLGNESTDFLSERWKGYVRLGIGHRKNQRSRDRFVG